MVSRQVLKYLRILKRYLDGLFRPNDTDQYQFQYHMCDPVRKNVLRNASTEQKRRRTTGAAGGDSEENHNHDRCRRTQQRLLGSVSPSQSCSKNASRYRVEIFL